MLALRCFADRIDRWHGRGELPHHHMARHVLACPPGGKVHDRQEVGQARHVNYATSTGLSK
jgi:hypothetical protein